MTDVPMYEADLVVMARIGDLLSGLTQPEINRVVAYLASRYTSPLVRITVNPQ